MRGARGDVAFHFFPEHLKMARTQTFEIPRVHCDTATRHALPCRYNALVCAMVIGAASAAWCWTATAWSADWPQWQGPDRNAISKETGLLQEWPEDGPSLAWRIKGLGGGYSAPSIAA